MDVLKINASSYNAQPDTMSGMLESPNKPGMSLPERLRFFLRHSSRSRFLFLNA